ncbi:MAG: hypothetical protein AB7E80_08420 [Hyphomicrobiaceae bacterium]
MTGFETALAFVSGLALLSTTWLLFLRLRPRNGVANALVASRAGLEVATLAFVFGNALGFALVVHGIIMLLK